VVSVGLKRSIFMSSIRVATKSLSVGTAAVAPSGWTGAAGRVGAPG